MTTDVALWFAQNANNTYTTIYNIDDKNKNDEFSCPVCLSKVYPRAIKNDALVSPHFYHKDTSKCNAESRIHWCYKNNFLIQGGKFSIKDRKTDSSTNYVCESIEIEKQHEKNGLVYRPDVTVTTTSGEIVFFEMDYSNKKRIEDYANVWLEFNHTVVEIDIKTLMQLNTFDNVFSFYPIFINGKCYGKDSKRQTTKDRIVELKESIYRKKSDIGREFVNNLDWFWHDLANYKMNKCEVDTLYYSLDYLIDNSDSKDKELLFEIIEKFRCNKVIDDYYEYKWKVIEPKLKKLFDDLEISNWYKYELNDYYKSSIYMCSKDGYVSRNFHFNDIGTDNIIEHIKDYMYECHKDIIQSLARRNCKYNFPNILNNYQINLTYRYSPYCKKLMRYDFVSMTKRLVELKYKIRSYIEQANSEIDSKEYLSYKKKNKFLSRVTYTDDSLNAELRKILYPITYICQNSNFEEIYIVLNADFTKDKNGRTQRWLIQDFIEALSYFNINTVTNNKGD